MTITRTVGTRMEMKQWGRSRMGIIHGDGTESGTIYSSVSLSILPASGLFGSQSTATQE